MLRICQGRIEETADSVMMHTPVYIDKELRTITVTVDKEYGKYLSPERSDYALAGLLSYAMRKGHDIVCEAPVTEELFFNVQEILIPTLVRNDPRIYASKIEAEIASPLEKMFVTSEVVKGGVGTGMSGGIDSFHVVAKHIASAYPRYNLTHVAVYNIGSFNNCYAESDPKKVKAKVFERAAEIAAEIGLPLVRVDTNFHVTFPQNHLQCHSFMDAFAMYALQKLWRVYYYASAYPYEYFKLADNSTLSNGSYDLLLLNRLSTAGLRIYCEGAETDRNGKTAVVADFAPARKFLHVCTRKPTNCGWCGKCLRTMLALEAIDKLDEFGAVFDLEDYRKNIDKVYTHLCQQNAAGNQFYEKSYRALYPKHKEQFDAINAALESSK